MQPIHPNLETLGPEPAKQDRRDHYPLPRPLHKIYAGPALETPPARYDSPPPFQNDTNMTLPSPLGESASPYIPYVRYLAWWGRYLIWALRVLGIQGVPGRKGDYQWSAPWGTGGTSSAWDTGSARDTAGGTGNLRGRNEVTPIVEVVIIVIRIPKVKIGVREGGALQLGFIVGTDRVPEARGVLAVVGGTPGIRGLLGVLEWLM